MNKSLLYPFPVGEEEPEFYDIPAYHSLIEEGMKNYYENIYLNYINV